MRVSRVAAAAVLLLVLGCGAPAPSRDAPEPTGSSSAGRPGTPTGPPPGPSAHPGPSSHRTPTARDAPLRFDADRARRDVVRLARGIGPRLATAAAFRVAARLVARRLRGLGFDVRRQSFPVPAGDSWGVAVPAGTSYNVIAEPPGFEPAAPHRLVGAHLDTVAVSPGAEDNASGVAVLLELARLASEGDTELPTVFVAYGAEEPRGPTDLDHHYGSRHHVETMGERRARSLRSMVAIDRVGVPGRVPVCTGPLSPLRVRDDLLRIARRLALPAEPCTLTTSDHWSFEKAGYTVARLGSRPYAAYHSARDLPTVVDTAQLRRTGRIAWAWLRR